MSRTSRIDLAHDFVFPTLLFMALGAMGWAVRGCSGFGAVNGCIYAGVLWGAGWWFLAQESPVDRPRRYASPWIILALTIGIGLSGARGWMQWPSFFEGKLQTDTAHGQFVPISRGYGFLWLFIAGVPWAGLGACALAWCGSLRETRLWHWALRIGFGLGTAALARKLYLAHPEIFLPLYHTMEKQYHQPRANPNLQRLINDCNAAITHLGYYLGFLTFELVRRDWKNALLITAVGLLNGLGWAVFQNWKWANALWGADTFNFWRCWESSGGISIGLAYGVAYFLVNRKMSEREMSIVSARPQIAGRSFEWMLVYSGLGFFVSLYLRETMGGWGSWYFAIVLAFGAIYYFKNRPNVEWVGLAIVATLIAAEFRNRQQLGQYGLAILGATMGAGWIWMMIRRSHIADERQSLPRREFGLEHWAVYLGMLVGLGLSIRNGLKGWFNIYRGNEDYWSAQLWRYLGPTYLVLLVVAAVVVIARRPSRGPNAYVWVWVVLIVQNAIAQLITGPLTQWREAAFSIYYLLLFAITAVIVMHYRRLAQIAPVRSAKSGG
jgi:hypothetical protein